MQTSQFNHQSTLVIGAGELGTAVIEALCETDTGATGRPSVLLRPESGGAAKPRNATLRHRGLSIVEADLATSSESELAAIFANFSTVICCTGFVSGAGTQRKITASVLEAQVPRYIPWQFGVDYDVVGRGSGQDLFDEQSDVRDMLRSQFRTRWIIISTGMFTSFLFEPSFGVVDLQGGKVHALGSWDNRLTVTTPGDIGRLTAAILVHQPPIENQIVYIAGDTITYARLAEMVEHHLGRPVDRVLWDMDTLRSEVAAHPDDGLRKYHLAFARDTGVAWDMENTFNGQQNIGLTDVPAWLESRVRPGDAK